MRLDTISPDAWRKLQDKYPGAYHILLESSLQGEYKVLSAELRHGFLNPLRKRWIIDRLADLEKCPGVAEAVS